MGEAIIISVLCILSIFGIHKIFEMLLNLRKTVDKEKLMLVYKMSDREQNAEMTVRALALESDNNIFVACEQAEGEVYEICVKTAFQYRNVFVGTTADLQNLLQQ
ncbi:MAG: hypothetical protein IJ027_03440 [Oscillospiraceae bacterium]|nr:hypothetical protein [Oscillospiraceae bacterium]